MREIPGGIFIFSTVAPKSEIPYPVNASEVIMKMNRFYMDRYPVTNKQFYEFLMATGYKPENQVNYLKHWENGTFPYGQDDYPVVYIDVEDAKAYAAWAGKRLPTEAEWQYAAQGNDERTWPWGNEFHATKCNNGFNRPTPVDAFPKGASPFGIEDLIGNVWQLTSDVYDNGSYYFVMIRGGSYYDSNIDDRLISGGPVPVNQRQMLLLMSPGLDRNSTIGFRCVKDAEQEDR